VAAPTASISVRVFTCPQDMTPDTLVGDNCDPAPDGYAVNVTGAGDLNLTLDDATKKDNAYTWSGLSLGKDQKATFTVTETTLPQGFSSYVIVGSQAGKPNTPYDTTLTADQPDAELGIYNFTSRAGGGGSISLTGYACPSADSSADDCKANGTVALDGAVITASGGQQLTAADANRDGDTFSWPIVPFDTYTLDGSSIVPDGYTLGSVSGANGPTNNGGYTFDISATSPTATIAVYLVGGNGGGAQPTATVGPTATTGTGTPTDTDGDGVSDADEATIGTDPNNVDTDGDCHSDGAEVNAGTNPLDASSFPDGDCDVAS
ncbi:MAG TPA: thrombospondin type 3 repeat-containing protein, partial [Thermomicrobiales bacterium]|nr:thrombospondin type 3 repeat-containing protein [Thermomicrobiales bacterium]